MPSPSEVAQFQRLIAQLSGAALTAVKALWNSTQDWNELQETYPDLIDPYLSGAAEITAEWYQSLAPDADFTVELPDLTPRDVLQASTRWALTEADPIEAITSSTEGRVFNTSRDTVQLNAEREHVKYARHASANACGWCRVMATRGAVYHSEEAAVKGHDRCHCVAVPDREGNPFEPAPYVDGFWDEYNEARDEVGGNIDDIVNYLRRKDHAANPAENRQYYQKYYGDNKDRILAQQRQRYAAKTYDKTSPQGD